MGRPWSFHLCLWLGIVTIAAGLYAGIDSLAFAHSTELADWRYRYAIAETAELTENRLNTVPPPPTGAVLNQIQLAEGIGSVLFGLLLIVFTGVIGLLGEIAALLAAQRRPAQADTWPRWPNGDPH